MQGNAQFWFQGETGKMTLGLFVSYFRFSD